MAAYSLKNPPKPPADFSAELAGVWKDSCLRVIDATGSIYKSDLPYIEMYCRSYQRWKEIQAHANQSGLYDERMKLNEVYKFESELANKLKQNYRALENTVLERVRAGQPGRASKAGGQGYVRKRHGTGCRRLAQPKRRVPAAYPGWMMRAKRRIRRRRDSWYSALYCNHNNSSEVRMRTNTDINVVSFSGGRTSAYLVWLLEQKRRNEGLEVHYIFMDTGAEHPKTYEFIKDVAFYFDIDLVCLRLDASTPLGKGNRYDVCSVEEIGPDLKPFTGMVKKYGSPGIPSPWCTSRMKVDTHEAYCNERFGKGNFITWLGIRADEKRRLKRKENLAYLADISDATKDDIIDWWAGMFFDLEIHEHLGNCVFCFKKGDGKLALAARDYPEGYEKFWSMITSAENRIPPGKDDNSIMYRNHRSLPEVIAQFEEFSYKEIWDSLRFTKKFDTNSCSESCEVFNFDE